MSTLFDDDLTDEELAYLNSGGKTDLPSAPADPAASGDQGEGQQQPDPAASSAQQEGQEAEDLGDEDDDGEEVVIVGKDGRPRAKSGKFVSHQALHKEREKHKATKAEMQSLRDKLARGEERLAILNEAFSSSGQQPGQQQAKPETPKNPYEEETIDAETDFMGWAKQMQRRAEYNFKAQTESQQMVAARDNFQRLTASYHDDARRFMAEEPQFADAYKHLVNARHIELKAMGMTDEAKRNAYIAQEETQLVIQAFQNGQRPSKVIYEFARARGFGGNGGAPAQPAAAAPGAPASQSAQLPNAAAAAQKIQQVRNGQAAAQSLSNTAGGAAKTLTMDTLANMSDEEFAAAVDGMSKAQIRAILGG